MRLRLFVTFCFLYFNLNAQRNIHIFVALCDNENQGIVPVPKAIGNGQDPKNNLYWGCGYGIKTYFNKSAEWKLVKTIKNPQKNILERLVFKHKTQNSYLCADAYDGARIKECTVDFLNAAAGKLSTRVEIDSCFYEFGKKSSLVAYIGHNGLMDFDLEEYPQPADTVKRDAIVLACASKPYFKNILTNAGANPVLMTAQLMCPEAYSVKAAIDSWLKKETAAQIRHSAAAAYSKYQKCSLKAALSIMVN